MQDQPINNTLKPCRKCGSRGAYLVENEDIGAARICCNKCDTATRWYMGIDHNDEAILLWNNGDIITEWKTL